MMKILSLILVLTLFLCVTGDLNKLDHNSRSFRQLDSSDSSDTLDTLTNTNTNTNPNTRRSYGVNRVRSVRRSRPLSTNPNVITEPTIGGAAQSIANTVDSVIPHV